MIPRFGHSVSELCNISNTVMNIIYDQHSNLFSSLCQPWLSSANFQSFPEAIHAKGASLVNYRGFVDGTVTPVILYNGHKKVHSIKFQSVVAPNGLIANTYLDLLRGMDM